MSGQSSNSIRTVVFSRRSFRGAWKDDIKPEIIDQGEDIVAKTNAGLTTDTNKGSRLWPPRNGQNDKKIGRRLDWGEIWRDAKTGIQYKNIQVQPNDGAVSKALRELAREDTHQKLGTIAIPTSREVSIVDTISGGN